MGLIQAYRAEPSHDTAPLPEDALERHWIVGAWIRCEHNDRHPYYTVYVVRGDNVAIVIHGDSSDVGRRLNIEDITGEMRTGWSFAGGPIQTKRDLP